MNPENFLGWEGFDWDEGNSEKNWIKHKVAPSECEQIFLNQPLIISEDIEHSQEEKRLYALGHTNLNRLLFISFTVRRNLIRVVSARNMSRRERKVYSEYEEKTDT